MTAASVKQARAAGRSIEFIGHNIHHVFDISGRFVVADCGRVARQITKAKLGNAMPCAALPKGATQTKAWPFGPSARTALRWGRWRCRS